MIYLNYITLWRLADELHTQLFQAILIESFSQQKDELILGFSKSNNQDFFLRISCQSQFPYFVPVHEYHRAGKNSVNLFDNLVGSVVQSVKIYPGDRILGIQVLNSENENHWLVCKMHGSRSNIIHFFHNKSIEAFRKKLDLHWELDCQVFETNPWDWLATHEKWTFWDKNFKQEYGEQSIQTIEKILQSPLYVSSEPTELCMGKNENFQSFVSVSDALSFFLRQKCREDALSNLFEEVNVKLQQEIKQRKGKIQSWWKSLEHLANTRSYEEIGHLILSNIQEIGHYCAEIEVDDWYTGSKTHIKLDPKLNAQDNAQLYYRKHKVRQKEEKYLLKRVEEAEKELEKWLQWQIEITEIKSVKVLEKWVKNHPELRMATRLKIKNELPFRKFEKNGYQIYIGRDSKNNDELTVQFAKKDDIWLHAKDVAGSHVVIRMPDSKPLPNEVLQFAAGLAAWYSKVRNQNWVPVIFTQKKYVRKGKGFGPGKVSVEREEVIFVNPIKPGRDD